ncbi:hypothetical protein ACFSC4_28505 [Deinococcus malanensis]|uniref:hypothetical protein n=1 Tax=Deinococcus malanensis TaxID=1706855 RepID=UPI00362754A5
MGESCFVAGSGGGPARHCSGHRGPSADRADLGATIGTHSLLLVLDNFEHLPTAAADIAALANITSNLRILITSRCALHVRGEHELPLGPPTSNPSKQGLESAAVRLFVDCVQAVDPHFRLTPANEPVVSRICCLLDGIPLALELAASRLRAVTVDGLLAWLERPSRC